LCLWCFRLCLRCFRRFLALLSLACLSLALRCFVLLLRENPRRRQGKHRKQHPVSGLEPGRGCHCSLLGSVLQTFDLNRFVCTLLSRRLTGLFASAKPPPAAPVQPTTLVSSIFHYHTQENFP